MIPDCDAASAFSWNSSKTSLEHLEYYGRFKIYLMQSKVWHPDEFAAVSSSLDIQRTCCNNPACCINTKNRSAGSFYEAAQVFGHQLMPQLPTATATHLISFLQSAFHRFNSRLYYWHCSAKVLHIARLVSNTRHELNSAWSGPQLHEKVAMLGNVLTANNGDMSIALFPAISTSQHLNELRQCWHVYAPL